MGLLRRLRANVGMLSAALAPLRERGHGTGAALLRELPTAVALRGWRKVAQAINARLLNRALNARRFATFQRRLPAVTTLRLYVTVMPNTLHFLLPCLALLHGKAPLVLLFNGAKNWERRLLRERLPDVPAFSLCNLPGSSLPHGDVVSLLLRQHCGDFAIIDHDAYLFESRLLPRLRPTAGEAAVGVFSQHSAQAGWDYPLTHLLAFNAEALRRLMLRHRVDARQCRRAPRRLADLMGSVGVGPGRHLKDYQNFHDTLHVLLALARAEGLRLRFEPDRDALLKSAAEPPVLHVGGTSIGSHHTKSLFALYIQLRFLEFIDDPLLRRRYAFLVQPLRNSDEALRRRNPADSAWQSLPVVDSLLRRLEAAGAGHAFLTTVDSIPPVRSGALS